MTEKRQGWDQHQVSVLWRCPFYRGVRLERVDCIAIIIVVVVIAHVVDVVVVVIIHVVVIVVTVMKSL